MDWFQIKLYNISEIRYKLWQYFNGNILHCLYILRAEGSSKIHSRLEQQTSRLSQQIKSNNSSSSNKSSSCSKSSPPKEKTSPSSPMDDIERGDMVLGKMGVLELPYHLFVEGFGTLASWIDIVSLLGFIQWALCSTNVETCFTFLNLSVCTSMVCRVDGGGTGHGPAEHWRQLVRLQQLLILQQWRQFQQQWLRGWTDLSAELNPGQSQHAYHQHQHWNQQSPPGEWRGTNEHTQWVLTSLLLSARGSLSWFWALDIYIESGSCP